MKSQDPVVDAISELKRGDEALNNQDFHKAADYYRSGIRLAQSVPRDRLIDPKRILSKAVTFDDLTSARGGSSDQPDFLAHCYSGLSSALTRLGNANDVLESANEALRFFDSTYPRKPILSRPHMEKWIKAICNRGVSLFALGQREEALRCMKRARNILQDRGMWNLDRSLCRLIESNIQRIAST